MSEQVWKSLVDFGYSRYSVSENGKLWDNKRDVEVSQFLSGVPEYWYANVWNDEGKRKQERAHRLVAFAFVEGWSEEYNVVDHIDRDKLNNHYMNLRWTDTSGNQRNIENNLVLEDGTYLKDYVQKYDNPDAAYIYLSVKYKECGNCWETAINEYHNYLKYGYKNKQVEWEGKTVYLKDLVESVGADYDKVISNLHNGYPVWNALYTIPEEHFYSLEVKTKTAISYWYKTKETLCKDIPGKSMEAITMFLEQGMCFEDIMEHEYIDVYRKEVLGIRGTIPELCKHFNLTESCVKTRMEKGMTLEQALTTKQGKLKYVKINGVRDTLKNWYEYFDLEYKKVKSYRDRTKCSFEETLEHFGVDLSSIEISYEV